MSESSKTDNVTPPESCSMEEPIRTVTVHLRLSQSVDMKVLREVADYIGFRTEVVADHAWNKLYGSDISRIKIDPLLRVTRFE